jgi:hypothetical protein
MTIPISWTSSEPTTDSLTIVGVVLELELEELLLVVVLELRVGVMAVGVVVVVVIGRLVSTGVVVAVELVLLFITSS